MADDAKAARLPLTRERVLTAAVAFIDEHGRTELTMRRLGSELGVEAMSLYRYVPGREALLDGVVEVILAELEADPEVLSSPVHGWQDFLQRLAHGLRKVAIEHPRVFPLVASRPTQAPWIRPPLRSLRWIENFFAGLKDCGFSDEAAVGAYRAYTSFLLGHLLLEVSTKGADVSAVDELQSQKAQGASDGPPDRDEVPSYLHISRLSPLLREDHSKEEFEDSLESLLERVELMR